MTNRREFLQTTAAITGVSLLPTSRLATPAPTFFFVHTNLAGSFQVANPVQWCLEHAHKPVLERAKDGLRNLSTTDSERIVRLAVRRCGLNLVEIKSNQVTVHYWAQQLADLRPFFRSAGLARSEVQVTLLDRKKEVATQKSGDDFLYGQAIAADFPIQLLMSKWHNRFLVESDDHQAVPGSKSGFAWNGLEDGQIPWAAIKSAWRNGDGTVCLNCSGGAILINFGLRQVGVFNRSPNFISICPQCQRSFVDESIRDVGGWMAMNLDADFCPVGEVVRGKVTGIVRPEQLPS